MLFLNKEKLILNSREFIGLEIKQAWVEVIFKFGALKNHCRS